MKKVLIIEDEASIRDNLEEILRLSDYETLKAADGEIGLKLAQTESPDLIICDIMLPKLDGYEILKAVRQNEATAHLPFVFLTAKVDRCDIRLGMEFGADDYLTKPFTATELLNTIATQLDKQATRDRQVQNQLEQLRSQIALSLPHELYTPLNGILGMSQILLEEHNNIEPAEVQEIATTIHQSGLRLYHLLQNFVLYTELELMVTNPQRVTDLRNKVHPCSVKDVITKIASEKAKAVDRVADLYIEIEEDKVMLDGRHLQKIVEEVVDNAFKFSMVGTPVCVMGKACQKTFQLGISDCGRGLTPQQIAQIGAYMQFERRIYEQQGSGLGLTLAKRLIELYGGELAIESVPYEKTTIWMILPTVSTGEQKYL